MFNYRLICVGSQRKFGLAGQTGIIKSHLPTLVTGMSQLIQAHLAAEIIHEQNLALLDFGRFLHGASIPSFGSRGGIAHPRIIHVTRANDPTGITADKLRRAILADTQQGIRLVGRTPKNLAALFTSSVSYFSQ